MIEHSEKGEYAPAETNDTPTTITPAEVEEKVNIVEGAEGVEEAEVTTITPPDADSPHLSGRDMYLVILAIGLTIFMASLDTTIVATASPQISSEFRALDSISWVATAYMLSANALQPVYGKLSDIFGRKATYMFAIALFLVGSAICGAAQSINMLIGARAVQGLGAAGCFSLSMIIVTESSGVREAGKFIGILSGVFALSSVLGPVVGGALTDISSSSWRWIFYINLPVGIPTLFLIFFFLKLVRSSTGGTFRDKLARIDFLGIAVFVAGIVCILLALSWGGGTYPWNSARVIVLFCVGGVLLLVFVAVEMRVARDPMVMMELFAKRNFVATALFSLPFGTVMFGLIFFIPLYFQVIKGNRAVVAGLHLIPFMLSFAFLAGVSGFLISKTGLYRPFIWTGSAIMSVGTGLLILWEQDSSNAAYILFPLVVGMGMGLCMQTILSAGQSQLDRTTLASGTALVNFFRTIGGVLGLAIFTTIMNSKLTSEIEHARPNDAVFVIGIARKGFEVFDKLNEEQLAVVKEAYSTALRTIFIAMVPFSVLTFVISLFYIHVPLPSRNQDNQSAAGKVSAERSNGEESNA
ncbi:MFS general substrate transporter [Ramicandelaber brevisporus]|nr:MFS general substrate transporter [Ramicandelaber brevisporus]